MFPSDIKLSLSMHFTRVPCEQNMLRILGKKFKRQHFEIFFLFSQKIGSDISYKLSP